MSLDIQHHYVPAPSDAEDAETSSLWNGINIAFFTDLGNNFLRSIGLLGKKRVRDDSYSMDDSTEYSADCCFGSSGKRLRGDYDDYEE
uniref:Uncharacterized protein n=1 Tax=Lepeophtheirus salmonis TaxID=72036 RepID=A0A0K2UF17_LEPSM